MWYISLWLTAFDEQEGAYERNDIDERHELVVVDVELLQQNRDSLVRRAAHSNPRQDLASSLQGIPKGRNRGEPMCDNL